MAILPELGRGIKRLTRGDVFVVIVIILVGFSGFGLGRLSKISQEKPPVALENVFPPQAVATTDEASAQTEGAVLEAQTTSRELLVGSKNSNKYHFPWCSGAQRIKEENKIWFSSREEAEAAGYEPAKNCKGL